MFRKLLDKKFVSHYGKLFSRGLKKNSSVNYLQRTAKRFNSSEQNNFNKKDSPIHNGDHPFWGVMLASECIGAIGGGLLFGTILASDSEDNISKTFNFIGGFSFGAILGIVLLSGLTAGAGATYFTARYVGRNLTQHNKNGLFSGSKGKQMTQHEIPEISFKPINERQHIKNSKSLR